MKRIFGLGLDIPTMKLMRESEDKLKLLSLIDVLVDGRFLIQKKDLTLRLEGVVINVL